MGSYVGLRRTAMISCFCSYNGTCDGCVNRKVPKGFPKNNHISWKVAQDVLALYLVLKRTGKALVNHIDSYQEDRYAENVSEHTDIQGFQESGPG